MRHILAGLGLASLVVGSVIVVAVVTMSAKILGDFLSPEWGFALVMIVFGVLFWTGIGVALSRFFDGS